MRAYGACAIREVDRFVLTAPLFSWEKEREPFFAPWPWDGFRKLSQAQANSPQVPRFRPSFFFRSLFFSHSGRQMTSREGFTASRLQSMVTAPELVPYSLVPKTRPRGPETVSISLRGLRPHAHLDFTYANFFFFSL